MTARKFAYFGFNCEFHLVLFVERVRDLDLQELATTIRIIRVVQIDRFGTIRFSRCHR